MARSNNYNSNMWVFLMAVTFGIIITPTVICAELNAITIEEYLADPKSYNLPIIPKCCNLTEDQNSDGPGCVDSTSLLPLQPDLYESNQTHLNHITYDRLTIVVGHQCHFGKFSLDSNKYSEDEYYLLNDGRIFTPHLKPKHRKIGEYCLDRIQGTLEVIPLLCFESLTAENIGSKAKMIVYAAALIISIPFLVATLFVFLGIKKLRDLYGKILANYVGFLTIAFIALAIVQLNGESLENPGCVITAYIIQFSFLLSFVWLNILCIHLYMSVKFYLDRELKPEETKNKMLIYSGCGYGIPAVIFVITLFMDILPGVPKRLIKPGFGESSCWFQSKESAQWFFYGPMGLSMSINVVMFIITLITLCNKLPQTKKSVDISNTEEFEFIASMKLRCRQCSRWLKICFMLFFIMGISWCFEFISWATGSDHVVWMVFDMFNGLQGVTIFIVTVIYPKPIRNDVYYALRKCSHSFWKKSEDGYELNGLNDNKNNVNPIVSELTNTNNV